MDRPGVHQVPEGSGAQGKMEHREKWRKLITKLFVLPQRPSLLSLFLTGRTISSPIWFGQFDELCFVSELSDRRTSRSLNMVWTVQWTILRFLTDFLMRSTLQPKLRCAGCTQTCVHMLTNDTCSLSSIHSQKPWQWMLQLCDTLTYLLLFICWVLQITLTIPQVHKWGHFHWSERLKTVSHVLLSQFFPLPYESSDFNQSDARFVKRDE